MLLKRTLKHDRRSRRRQLLNISVRVFTGPAHVDALGINLSDTGMCLFAIANLPVGSQIQVEFLPPDCEERVLIRGAVRYRALYLYGIEFLVDSQRPARRANAGTLAGRGAVYP
jgi:PilZ domain